MESPTIRVGDIYPQLISRYIATEAARNIRNTRNIRPNLFSMLYNRTGAPTNEQIRQATSNTMNSMTQVKSR
jgi:hypothetical protein